MSDHPAVVPVETAQALLAKLREVKDDFRAVDAAVANSVHEGRERIAKSATRWHGWHTASWAGPGAVTGQSLGPAAERLVDSGLLSMSFESGSGASWGCMLVGASVAGVTGWWHGRTRSAAVRAEAEQLCDDFLFAGVAVELALGDLRTALDDARRGRPGSAGTLAARATAATEAFEHYAAAVRPLDGTGVDVRFPQTGVDIDGALALQLLSAHTEAVLARAGRIAVAALDPSAAMVGGLPGPRRQAIAAATPATPAGGLDAVIATAEALRGQLEAASRTLEAVEDTIRRVQRAPTDIDAQTLERLAQIVAEAHLREGLAEADCLGIENAAREAANADTVPQSLHHLAAAPSATDLCEAFDGYASSLHAAVLQLTAAGDGSRPLSEAGGTAESIWNDIPRLTSTANALATTLDTVLTHINQLATS